MAKEHPEHEPRDVGTGERLAHLASAMGNATAHKMQGETQTEEGARQQVDAASLESLLASWPEAPRKGAREMIEQYGPPNEATPTKLFWYRNGPWKRTMVTRDVVLHNFPAPHSDYLTQYIDYKVPTDLFDEVGLFDASCLVDRTAGEVAARCDTEAANFLTLNLMHEIVTRQRSVDDAREFYAQALAAYAMGRSSPYAESFQFAVPHGGTGDPDESMMAGAAARQMAGKGKGVLTGDSEPQPGGDAAAGPSIGDAPHSPTFPFGKSQ